MVRTVNSIVLWQRLQEGKKDMANTGKYRLVAVDMDGTLLNDEKEVSPVTLEALKKLQTGGIPLTICTGRNISGIERFMETLKPEGPIICNNGAVIMAPGGNETIFNCTMDKADARRVYELGLSLKATLLIWCRNVFYTNELNERSYGYKKYSGLDPVIVEDFDRLNEAGITKILLCSESREVDAYLEKVEGMRASEQGFLSETTFCKSLPIFLEFFSNRVSKGKALEFIASHLGISMKEVISFGDGMNDYPMIEKSGLGIAMGNACRELKKKASFVTLDNNSDGIAFALSFLKILN